MAVVRTSVQVVVLVEACHFRTEPVSPARVIVVPVPRQTALAAGVAVPPSEIAATVNAATAEVLVPLALLTKQR